MFVNDREHSIQEGFRAWAMLLLLSILFAGGLFFLFNEFRESGNVFLSINPNGEDYAENALIAAAAFCLQLLMIGGCAVLFVSSVILTVITGGKLVVRCWNENQRS